MKKPSPLLTSAGGFTLMELALTVVVLGILFSIAALSYNTLLAKARYSSIKANMDIIAKAGYVDYTSNMGVWDFSPNPWTAPPSIMGTGLLETWPQITCPGWYLSWDNGALFGLNDVRITLRRPDDTPYWSYCVNTFGGGNCNGPDMYTHQPTIEITTADVNHLYCTE